MILNHFLNKYLPSQTNPANKEVLAKYDQLLPYSLIELWETYGFGKYHDGLIEIINPDDYQDTLATWLGKKVEKYVPIALSAFGDLFYYRKLTEHDEDVCVLDPHYKNIATCTWDSTYFFNEYLCDDVTMHDVLKIDLFQESVKKNGILQPQEIYMFVPALALGGAEEIQYVSKGNGIVHLDILFQL